MNFIAYFFLSFSECCEAVVDYIIDIDTVVQPRSGLRSRLTDTVKCVKKNICITLSTETLIISCSEGNSYDNKHAKERKEEI